MRVIGSCRRIDHVLMLRGMNGNGMYKRLNLRVLSVLNRWDMTQLSRTGLRKRWNAKQSASCLQHLRADFQQKKHVRLFGHLLMYETRIFSHCIYWAKWCRAWIFTLGYICRRD